MAEINSIQRQRILHLMVKESNLNGLLDKPERDELTALQQLAGIAPDAPLDLIRKWALGQLGATIPNSMQRSMSHRQRELELMRMRWPRQPMSGRQAVVALWRERMDWDLSPKQRQLQRMRQSWT